jgi:protein phosphatase
VTLVLRAAARTDVGLRRDNNEDAMYAGRRLVAIADGMGGQAFGEVASRVAILTVARLDDDRGSDLITSLRDAIGDANEQLRSMIASDSELDGMGTTFTALLTSGGRLALAHVGDSRAYVLSDGELSQVTRDHSLVQSLVDSGQITAEDAAHHPSRSVITRALDGHGDVEPDVGMLEARAGDRYLLCSDGLSDVVTPDTIAEALAQPDRERVCDRLVELALRAGGPDNVTVVVADVVDDSTDPAPTPVVIGGSADDVDDPPDEHPDTAAGRAAGLAQRDAGRGGAAGLLRIPPGPGRWIAAVLGGAVVVAGLAVLGIVVYSRGQFYVGSAGSPPTVAVYQGVPGGVLGIDLSRLRTTTDIPVAQLPEDDRDRVADGIGTGSQTSAQAIVTTLRGDGCSNATVTRRVRVAGQGSGKRPRTKLVTIRPAWCTS